MLKVIGYERSKGISKEGKAYDIQKFYAVEVDKVVAHIDTEKRKVEGFGFTCNEYVWYAHKKGYLLPVPSMADYIDVTTFNGWLQGLTIINPNDVVVPHEPIVI